MREFGRNPCAARCPAKPCVVKGVVERVLAVKGGHGDAVCPDIRQEILASADAARHHPCRLSRALA